MFRYLAECLLPHIIFLISIIWISIWFFNMVYNTSFQKRSKCFAVLGLKLFLYINVDATHGIPIEFEWREYTNLACREISPSSTISRILPCSFRNSNVLFNALYILLTFFSIWMPWFYVSEEVSKKTSEHGCL